MAFGTPLTRMRRSREMGNISDTITTSATEAEQVVLSVRDLSIDYHLRTHILHAVRAVSFDLRKGKTLCLVGESGSGKSVTARAILRIIDKQARVTSGTIVLNDGDSQIPIHELDEDSRSIRSIRGRRISLIFQEPMSSLSPVHTIGAQIVEALQLHRKLDKKAARAETIELLRQVEIADPETMIDRYTFEFSGGMRQRAMIAMALACDPDILIADEPTTALDVTTQAEILDLIKRLQQTRGMAMLLITHDLGIVAETCQRVGVMYAGNLCEVADVQELFSNPRHPYTQALLAAVPKFNQEGQLMSIGGNVPNLVTPPPGCRFHPRCAQAKPACRKRFPTDTHLGNNHTVACYLYTDQPRANVP